MYILEVIPLTYIPRNQAQVLSYFYTSELPRGAVVEIPLGRRTAQAIVITSGSLKDRKLDFRKNASFQLKSIVGVISAEPRVSTSQLEIAKFLSNYYFASLGLCLKTVLPTFWDKKYYSLVSQKNDSDELSKNNDTKYLETSPETVRQDYGPIISATFTAQKQVLLVVPDITMGRHLQNIFKDLSPELLSSELPAKKQHSIWQKAADGSARFIIATKIGLFLPFKELGLMIIDEEGHPAYDAEQTPRYNVVILSHFIASLHGAKRILGAPFPRIETFHRLIKDTGASPLRPQAHIAVIDMVREIRDANYSLFSRELQDMLLETVRDNRQIILYVPRRGSAACLFCQTCGYIVECPHCSVSLKPHEPSIVMCHTCGYSTQQPKRCSKCNVPALKSLGTGIEKILADLEKFYTYRNWKVPAIFQIDSDSFKNTATEEKYLEEFRQTRPAILVSTQSLFSYKYLLKVPYIGIIQADSLIHIPDFRSEELLLRSIQTLAQMTDEVVLQTYTPQAGLYQHLQSQQLHSYLETELETRKMLGYPPFSQLIKLSYRHKDALKAKTEAKILFEKLKRATNDLKASVVISEPIPAFIKKEKGFYVWNILLKAKNTPIHQRNQLLAYVPASWLTEVDPKSSI